MESDNLQQGVAGNTDDDHRLLTKAGVHSIFERVANLADGSGELAVNVEAWWNGSLHWARNRVTVAGDQRDVHLEIRRTNHLGTGRVKVNQTDDTSLRVAIRAAERAMHLGFAKSLGERAIHDPLQNPLMPYPDTAIWSEATYRVTPEQRAVVGQALVEGAEAQNLLSAGRLEMQVYEGHEFRRRGHPNDQRLDELPEGRGGDRKSRWPQYERYTQAVCSMTVRHPKGVGSGWAGLSSYDWSVIDGPLLAERALDKCVRSLNPVAIEPGRYTVILEPQAVFPFATRLIGRREENEDLKKPGKYSLEVDPALKKRMTKLGLQVVDERISVHGDPMDPRLGNVPRLGMAPVTWIDRGVLKAISLDRWYALNELRLDLPVIGSGFMMTGGPTSMDEMIATTKRGLIVTRFSGIEAVPGTGPSVVITGFTRDGLWLVENGKISKAVKNMRFTDSPFFVFNQVEQLGPPVPVFAPTRVGNGALAPSIVPPVKSRDFAFTATVEAI